MVDKPAEKKPQGRQGRTKNSGNVTNLSGAIKQQRQSPNTQQKYQNSFPNSLLLDLFERVNRIFRSDDDQTLISARFLELCREVFACDQVWLLNGKTGHWSIDLFSCRPQTPLDPARTGPLADNLTSFFTRMHAGGRPIALTAAMHDPIAVTLSEQFDCHSLLLMPLEVYDAQPAILLINQRNQLRIWNNDELRLLQELTQRLHDGLERSRAAEIQQRLNRLQQTTLATLPLPLLEVGTDRRICQCNPEAEKLLSISAEKALGQTLQQLLPEFPWLEEALDRVLETRENMQLGRFPWRRTEQSRLFAFSLYPAADLSSTTVLLRINDVTEQAQLEEFASQQERMVSIGNLAAGVAQEINNPLASILQNLQVMRNRLHPNLPKNIELAQECGLDIDHLDHYVEERGIHAILNAAITSGKKAADIVHNMLNFSQKDNSGFHHHRLNTLLDKAVELAAGNYHLHGNLDFRKIEIVRHYDQDLPASYCSPGQLQQVFLHLLNSGAHALTKRLHFWDRNRATLPSEEKPRLILRLIKQRDSLLCEIEDNGCGMEEELRKRIFEPFHAAPKSDSGAGLGLGMSICYFIICKNHGGRMSVDSRPDVGSRFSLVLPLKSPEEPSSSAG